VAALTSDNTENAAASPYVIATTNLGVTALPHLVNALLVTSIFSAGNTYTYCATRSLYGLALEGRAPRFLRKCTSSGVPLACFGIVICFPFLSFMAVSKGSAQVLKWLVSLVTAGGLIDYIVICITYLRFYYACRLQKIDRSTFPYVGRLQPFCGWVGLVCMSLVCLLYGYATLRPPDLAGFLFHYTMAIVDPILYIVWKLLKGTRIVSLQEIDLVWERPIIDAYEAGLEGQPSTFWAELGHLFARSKNKEPAPDCHTDESAILMLSVVAEAKT
jgi:yeast amino acid transporter